MRVPFRNFAGFALAFGFGAALLAASPCMAQSSNAPISLSSPGYGQEFSTPSSPRSSTDLPVSEVKSYSVAPAVSGNDFSGGSTYSQPVSNTDLDSGALRDARALVLSSEATLYRLMSNSGVKKSLDNLLPTARGILIVPSFTRAGFLVGGAWGNGVLLARHPSGQWSSPAFYRLTAGSIGLQIGIQDNEMIYMIMTEAGLRAVMEDQFKGGATASATFLFVGGGADASTTTNVGADIYGFSQSIGLYGGLNLEGTAVEPRYNWNRAVYGEGTSPTSIVIDGRFNSPIADGLRGFLNSRNTR